MERERERERECAQGKVFLYPSVLASLADVLTSEPRCLSTLI